ncbi:hypothetical protein E2562_021308 [Oryza meyeriana var. granulata]|uniref:Protein kinase domain-containing protein n=1 Tax=Oryza meyeriana var. granulata TaxID=110450 RepID=A0A6G1BXI5_9ORYZ|nr:hypothetical protein E2562_021308 [Oryza meyeriana var. granulata]
MGSAAATAAARTPWALQLGVVLTFLLATTSHGLNHEGWLLLTLKKQMVDTFHHLDDWNPWDPSPCGWKGVNCSSGSKPAVMSLNLSNMNLSGTVDPSIGGLAELTDLDLSFNGFSGTIPAEIGNCSKLVVLNLNNNQFQGMIPPELGKLSMLITFNLCNNKLLGPIPDEIGNMASLEDLVGYSNNLSGSIPHTIGRLKNLKTVRLGQNAISGNIPAEIEEIDFSENVLTGGVPKEFGNIPRLGACGTVYRAILKPGQTIAVKKLASNREGSNTDNSFRAEILTLGKIRHRNIVKLYGFIYHQGSNLLLYEYMSRGSLGELLHGQSSSSLDWETRFMIALGAAEGLSYLHHDCKPRIIHRDIKSNNILLDENFEAHVGDFGLAKL